MKQIINKHEYFAILICDENMSEAYLDDIVFKISTKKGIVYSNAKIDGQDKECYILYEVDNEDTKNYIFDMARNKKLEIIWKDKNFFGLISFKNNTKGDIICYLDEENGNEEIIKGQLRKINLKEEYKGKRKKIMHSMYLDEEQPYLYEEFCFYKKI